MNHQTAYLGPDVAGHVPADRDRRTAMPVSPLLVIFATRNGGARLRRSLASHAALRPPPVPARTIIVDNGSTDDTPGVLAEAAAQHDITVMREDQPGKNRALNRVMQHARNAELVVFTDDDVLPEPDWLQQLWQAAQAHPDYAIFGGAIRPCWMEPPPRWIFDWKVPIGVAYAATARQESGPIPADLVWGPNMAVRGAVLRQGHRFDDGVGPDGRAVYGMGSETEFITRLARHGHKAWFVAEAAVGHLIRPEQMTEAWLLGRAYRHGLGLLHYHPLDPNPRLPQIAGLPGSIALRFWRARIAAAAARHMPNGPLRFRLLWQEAWLQGLVACIRAGDQQSRGTGA